MIHPFGCYFLEGSFNLYEFGEEDSLDTKTK